MNLSNRFVSDFAAWAKDAGYPIRVLRRLPGLLRQLPERLSALDAQQTLFVRSLPNECSLRLRVETPTSGVYTSRDCIVFWAVGPSWNLRHMSSDEDASRIVEDFLFLAAQHALRSRILSSTAAVALAFDQLFDFRHANVQRVVFGPDSFASSLDEAFAHVHESLPPDGRSGTGRKSKSVRIWMRRLNAMDPYVQRGIFQYWRARSLWQSDFGEEAVTALDGLSSVASEALNRWTDLGAVPREQLAHEFHMNASDGRVLVSLYDLRCAFGAHPAASKWWDFGEMYGDSIESYFDTATRLLGGVSDLEAQHRSVDPSPAKWSEWFEHNACMLLDSVWFARLP